MNQVNFSLLNSKDPKVRYSEAKNLLTIAETSPYQLTDHINYFIEMLNSDNNIFKWTAIEILGHIATVTDDTKTRKIIDLIIPCLNKRNLITANHAISALSNIASRKQFFLDEITVALLKVEYYNYKTEECNNIAIGKVIEALGELFKSIDNKTPVLEFVSRQIGSSRNSTRKKAEKMLKYADKI